MEEGQGMTAGAALRAKAEQLIADRRLDIGSIEIVRDLLAHLDALTADLENARREFQASLAVKMASERDFRERADAAESALASTRAEVGAEFARAEHAENLQTAAEMKARAQELLREKADASLRQVTEDQGRFRADLQRHRSHCPRAPQPVWSGGRYQGFVTNPGGKCLRETGLEEALRTLLAHVTHGNGRLSYWLEGHDETISFSTTQDAIKAFELLRRIERAIAAALAGEEPQA